MANRKAKSIMIRVLLEETGKARILWELHYSKGGLAQRLSADDFLQGEIQESWLLLQAPFSRRAAQC